MVELLDAYIPLDRRLAISKGDDLPDRMHGSVLFADISGSTPLAEALVAELGTLRGADEFTVQLNRVYETLVTTVHSYGGSVIAFSGDAITCWFDRDDGARAVSCALALQEDMQHFTAVSTPAGATYALTIKVAVAAGSVRRFVVGDPTIQVFDVLAGATMDTMAEAEHLAYSQEIVVCPQIADQLGDRIEVAELRETNADGDPARTFAVVSGLDPLVHPDPASMPSYPPLADEQILPWLLSPVYDQLVSGQGQFLAALRPVVALFCRFEEIDYDHDEGAGKKLDAYIRWVQRTLAKHEGYMFQLTTGDKGSYLLAAFGATASHTDDAARAVAAALELQLPPTDLSFIARTQIGINRGRARVGAYGSSTRHIYSVLGDEINVAARLMGKAAPGQVVVSRQVRDAASRHFALKSMGAHEIKGKRLPMDLFGAVGRSQPHAVPFENALVGREAELGQMEQLVDLVLDGQGQILILEGDPGIGKSHLASEFTRRADLRGLRVARGICHSTVRAAAYAPWQQVFRTLLELPEELDYGGQPSPSERQVSQIEAFIQEINPDWSLRLPLLGDLLGLPIPDNEFTETLEPDMRQESLLALSVEFLQVLARREPQLLLFEDVQWMDEASLRLADAMRAAVGRAPILLVLVHRPAEGGQDPLLPALRRSPRCHQIRLQGLSRDGIASLLAERLQGALSPLALDIVETRAQRNPFFCEELVRSFSESRRIVRQANGVWDISPPLRQALQAANCLERIDGEWRLVENAPLSAADPEIPDEISVAVLSRLNRLSPAHGTVLKIASTIGRAFEYDVLAQAHPDRPGTDTLRAHLAALEDRDFVWLESTYPQTVYVFRHQTAQEVIYQTLPQNQQRAIHRDVGRALEDLQPEAVERLAYHFSRGEVRDKALRYLDEAARRAQRGYNNLSALSFFSQALAMEERWERRKGQIEALHVLGRRDEERAALLKLDTTPGAPAFDTAYLGGQYFEAVGEYALAQDAIGQAWADARQREDVAAQVRCLTYLGLVARRQGQPQEAERWYDQARNLLADIHAYPDEAMAMLNGLGTVYRGQGRFAEAADCYEQVLALSRERKDLLNEALALDSLGGLAYRQLDADKARDYHRQAIQIRQRIGDRPGEGTSLYNLALAYIAVGDYGEAEKHLASALAIQQAVENRYEMVNVLMGLGVLDLTLGVLNRAEARLLEGLTLSRDIGDREGEMFMQGNLGLVLREQGNLQSAQEQLNECLALAQAQDSKEVESMCLGHMAIVSLRAGRQDQAIAEANQSLKIRDEIGLHVLTTGDLATLALAHLASGEPEAAVDHARQAQSLLEQCAGEGPEYPHHDYFACYQVLDAAGQHQEALAALQSAYDLLTSYASNISDLDLRRSFLECVSVNRQIAQEAARHGIA